MRVRLGSFLKSLAGFRSKWWTIMLPSAILLIVFFAAAINNVFTKTYDIEKFSDAKETIRSPITIENKQETKQKTREIVQSVEDRYDVSAEITAARIGYIQEIFDAINVMDEDNKKSDQEEKNPSALPTTQEKLQKLKTVLSAEITDQVNDSAFIQLIEANQKDREAGKSILIDSLRNVLNNGVRTENVHTATTEAEQQIKYTSLNSSMKKSLVKLAEFGVVENSFFDVETTMEARKKAAASVDPVVIRAGEIIVREGQTITKEIYEELKLVGLLNTERNIYPAIGLVLLLLLITGVISYELFVLEKEKQLDKGKIATVLLISIMMVLLMKAVSIFTTQINQLYYVVPAAAGALLLKILLNERIAIVLAGMYAILGCVIFNDEIPGSLNIEAGVYFLFVQIAGIVFLVNVKDRLAILKAGIGMTIVNIIAVLLFLFLSFEKYTWYDLFIQSGLGFASAFLTAVVTIGLLPFFETGLGILSDTKLLALSNPNQPLLKKILTEAPGTYHHSVMVANLSETACEAIGANGLLARVGAYYHDIGKTRRPHYFIENQLSEKNPHDTMAPLDSAEIIIRHPYDGIDMLAKHHMPKEIIDIAAQHHGTTLLKYFYYKEKENDPHVKEAVFRYPGPKPQTKEAAVVCVCDSVEAAVRSLKEPTEEKIEEIVSSIIQDRLTDGQFDECSLTMHDIHQIHYTICETLKGIFHSRIQYPMKEAK